VLSLQVVAVVAAVLVGVILTSEMKTGLVPKCLLLSQVWAPTQVRVGFLAMVAQVTMRAQVLQVPQVRPDAQVQMAVEVGVGVVAVVVALDLLQAEQGERAESEGRGVMES